VESGDTITLDVANQRVQLNVEDATLAARRAKWQAPELPKRGWERLYVEHVLQAHQGADLDFLVGASGAEVKRESH
jgi:dihydroxy-acid dehydratase